MFFTFILSPSITTFCGNPFVCIVYYILLIYEAIPLGSEYHELSDTTTIVFVIENGSM